MKDVDCRQQLSYQMLRLFIRQRSIPSVKLVSKDFFTELKDAMDVFGVALIVLQNIQQPHKLFVVYQLAKQTDFTHGRIVYSIGYVLN
jgi:hypothetical protein